VSPPDPRVNFKRGPVVLLRPAACRRRTARSRRRRPTPRRMHYKATLRLLQLGQGEALEPGHRVRALLPLLLPGRLAPGAAGLGVGRRPGGRAERRGRGVERRGADPALRGRRRGRGRRRLGALARLAPRPRRRRLVGARVAGGRRRGGLGLGGRGALAAPRRDVEPPPRGRVPGRGLAGPVPGRARRSSRRSRAHSAAARPSAAGTTTGSSTAPPRP